MGEQSFRRPAQPAAVVLLTSRAPLVMAVLRGEVQPAVPMAQHDDYYGVLGVDRDASTREIRRAYRRLACQQHPDRNPEPDGAQRFRTLAEAYEVLSDPARRARYDHTTQPAGRRPPPRATAAVAARRACSNYQRAKRDSPPPRRSLSPPPTASRS
jgi:curved DNA-binding protein CbpA